MGLSSGRTHICALLDDSSVKCWGSNLNGQLGLGYDYQDAVEFSSWWIGNDPGEMGDNLSKLDLGNNRTVKSLESSNDHTCAILDNNNLKCWGVNDIGQLGLGDVDTRGNDPDEMGYKLPSIDLGTGRSVKR